MTAALLWRNPWLAIDWAERDERANKRSGDLPVRTTVGGNSQLNLDAINAVDTVNEQDQDEDKCYLQPVL